ncbi:MAG: proline--tRNA ligase [Bacilli bacterium]|nr:proline--tRNA ligase [Bacilli bacterium]MDD3305393.1 proline--tRNA ligase [Bacilli bacterium]MDD4053954.1 proline--tRNA ligase [Bacilli bacterium]MDD4411214.1 proline--tRNA ligase [Bacilli bacterium]
MKLKNNFFYTLRENVKDEDSISGNLLVRSGMIKKVSSGIYMFLPFGYITLKNIEQVIREEMNKAGALELCMTHMLPIDVFEKSGRVTAFGESIMRVNDRYNKKYILGPTHEEFFAIAASMKVKSYKDLPFTLYQFQTKFRDEARPRYGLIRTREFVMKDAYSFDIDLAGLDISYQKMFDAYKATFDRMGIDYKVVTADTGAMGGLLSEEFQALSDIGEDILVLCDKCDYASNIEVSECTISNEASDAEMKDLKEIYTPNVGTIRDLVENFDVNKEQLTKSMIYKVDDEFVMAMVRGDDDINEVKLRKLLGAEEVILADNNDVERITNANVGFAGPIDLNIRIIVDNRIKEMKNFLIGANKSDYHFINVNFDRDFKADIIADIRNIKEGDICPKCGGQIYFKKGIEIGNTFKLGTKYSEAMNLNYLDQENVLHPVVMGSYGIGPARVMAAIIEQNNDEKGIIWPLEIAPFKVAIVLINELDNSQKEYANELYNKLTLSKIECLLDDRDERVGVKFNDMDLIGIPIRITVGNKIKDNIVELKLRNSDEIKDIKEEKIFDCIKNIIEKR